MAILPKGAVPQQMIWEYLYSLLSANLNVGTVQSPNGPIAASGQGTNGSGKLQTVLTVGKSTWPQFNALPYVGVDLPKIQLKERYAAPNRDKLAIESRISIVVQVKAVSETVLLLDQAWSDLAEIIDDGAGNGVQAILRQDPLLQQLNPGNPLAIESFITDVEPLWDRSPAGGTAYIAWAVVTHITIVMAQDSG